MTQIRLTLFTLAWLAATMLHADENTTGMMLKLTDNTQQCIDLGKLQKINFEAGDMIMLFENGETQRVSLAEISTISFGSIPTAIEQMSNGKADAPYCIYNLKGEIVSQGKTSADGKATIGKELRGTYIIQVGNTCKTVVVK